MIGTGHLAVKRSLSMRIVRKDFEIGGILHLKSEISNFEIDSYLGSDFVTYV